jgi:hypothetical protein
VDDEVIVLVRKIEAPNVSSNEPNRGFAGKMWQSRYSRSWVTAKNCGARPKFQFTIAIGQTFQQPCAKESRCAG